MPTTEFVVAPLQPGSKIGDPDNAAGQAIKECGDTLGSASGLQDIHFGMQVEHEDNFQMVVNWDHIDKHKEFMAQESYKPFLEKFMSVAAGKPSICHADMVPEGAVNKTLAAPVTEIATFVFDGEPPSDYLEGVIKFGETMEKEKPEGFLGSAIGITHEELEKDGVKGKAAILTVGWQSVDAHMKFRETSTFSDNIGLLRNGVKAAEMHHVAMMAIV